MEKKHKKHKKEKKKKLHEETVDSASNELQNSTSPRSSEDAEVQLTTGEKRAILKKQRKQKFQENQEASDSNSTSSPIHPPIQIKPSQTDSPTESKSTDLNSTNTASNPLPQEEEIVAAPKHMGSFRPRPNRPLPNTPALKNSTTNSTTSVSPTNASPIAATIAIPTATTSSQAEASQSDSQTAMFTTVSLRSPRSPSGDSVLVNRLGAHRREPSSSQKQAEEIFVINF